MTNADQNKYIFKGRLWTITEPGQETPVLIPDVDTDQIFHNAYLHITEIEKMGQYSFDNLEGWKDFPEKAKPGDIILAGPNFGAGSSRQQAVDCFRALGVQAVIAVSFGAIYKRNAINSGFPILIFKDAETAVSAGKIPNLSTITIDLLEGRMTVEETGETFEMMPFSKVQKDIFDSGTLLKI